MSIKKNANELFEEIQKENGNSINQTIRKSKIDNQFLYNDEEEIFSFTDSSQISNNSIKLEDHNKVIKSDESCFDNKDIFIDNLENIIEERSVKEKDDKLDELLFCCQNIGKYIDEIKTRYEKNEYCESNLRDIHRMLIKEDNEFPKKRFCVLKWKIIENDIIPLILNYPDNHRVQLLSFIILVDMTQPINYSSNHNKTINEYLTITLSLISNNESLFKHIGNLISTSTIKLRESDVMRKDFMKENINLSEKNFEQNMINLFPDEKEKIFEIKKKIAEIENKYQQLIELVFTFLKQIFDIYNPHESWKNCEINLLLIKRMFDNKLFDAINYHTTSYESEFYKRISFNFLELLHFIFREFSVSQIFEITNIQKENIQSDSLLKRLRLEEQKQHLERKNRLSTRHNNFGTSIQVKRTNDNTSYIVTNINSLLNSVGTKERNFDFQKKKPKRRFWSKKFANEINEEVKFINDIKIKENFFLDPSNSQILLNIREFCTSLLEISFSKLTKYLFEEILKQSERIEKYDIYYFFAFVSFLLEFHRCLEHDKFEKEKERFKSQKKNLKFRINIDSIRYIIQTPLFDLSYKILFEQCLIKRKQDRKIFHFFSTLRFIKVILMISLDIHKINNDESFNINIIIQDSLLSRDYSRIIKHGFSIFDHEIFPIQILYDMIEFIELYFYCLETFSKVRKLKIKEKRRKRKQRDEENEEKDLLKLKKETKKENYLENKKIDHEYEINNYNSQSSISYSSDDYEFKERDVDLKNEIMIILDYDVISKILHALLEYKTIKSINLIRILAKLLNRVIELEGTWIFYNIENLNIFHMLINDHEFINNLFYRELYESINKILKIYFDLFKVNKLLLIESLFRFNSAVQKDEIINNYELKEQNDNYLYVRQDLELEKERIYGEDEQYEGNNLFFSNKIKKNKDIESVKWNLNEDIILIENYLKFKEIDNFMDILEGLFMNKKRKDIKKRIKKLKLKKGETKAMKRLNKIHKNFDEKSENYSNNKVIIL